MCALPPAGGAGLALVFAAGWTQSPAAWPVYAASVYALAVWAAALPGLVRRLCAAVRDSGPARVLRSTQLGRRYLDDAAFRGGVALCRGMAVNFLYALFRITEGIRYRSVWFISLAVYDLMLGAMRAGLAAGFRRLEAMGDNATVAVHINRVREKIELDPSHPRYIQTVWGAGYRFKGQ